MKSSVNLVNVWMVDEPAHNIIKTVINFNQTDLPMHNNTVLIVRVFITPTCKVLNEMIAYNVGSVRSFFVDIPNCQIKNCKVRTQ